MNSKKNEKNNNSVFSEKELRDELEESKQKNITMERETAQLKGIQLAMPDPYYVRDMDYNIVLWPESIAKVTGYTEAEAKKLKCYEIFKAAVCPPGSKCPTQQCITVKQFLKDVAVDVYNKKGATVHSLVSNAGIYDTDGNPIGAVEVVKDNTVIQATMNSIEETIKKIDSLSGTLNTAMEKVNNTSLKVDENASESLSEIESGVQTGNLVSQKAGESSKYAGNAQSNMKNINDSMKFSVENISQLAEKSQSIIEFIKIIQDISSKTNLLSINASIEAAHAGESGRGFKVVADGIRELSKISQDSAVSIKNAVNEINSLVKETTSSFDATEKDIESGTSTISELLSFVGDIASAINQLMSFINIIQKTASTTSRLVGEQKESINEVHNIGQELSEIAKTLTFEFDRIIKAIKHTDMG
ncbi:MAG: methyl-accepting chemotaxis protein [Treponema sp.]|nr:methyl-accepting chemotaxis protein [Treponema sp.]